MTITNAALPKACSTTRQYLVSTSDLLAVAPQIVKLSLTLSDPLPAERALPQRRQRLLHAVGRADLDLRVGDPALLVDHKVAANDAHELLAHERLLAPHAVGLGDRVLLVGQQDERQVVLGLELLVRLHAIGADAEHDRVLLLDLRVGIPESA